MRAFACISLAALLSGAAFGQSGEAAPTFEIADVHVSPRSNNAYMTGGVLRGVRYEIRKATMVDLVSLAYGVDGDKVLSGPSWLETDRFDVIAKAAPSTSPETAKLMLQALLADRFKLVAHKDSKPMPAYALLVGKGKPKLKVSDGPGEPGCQPPPSPQTPPAPGTVPYNVMECHGLTMAELAERIGGMAPAYIQNNPVVDMTKLDGTWDFSIKWTGRGALLAAGADGITFFDAVDKQLGLKLEMQTLPTPVVVVDSVNQKPTGNPPGVTTSLPPAPPAEFDVAELKPTDPDFKGITFDFKPSGQVNLRGVTVKFLIEQIWNITDDMLVGAPKWADTDRYDIVAKGSNLSTGSGNNQQVDFDSLLVMVRSLLEERFKLATHTEERPVSAYTLMAVKPKLQKGDPLTRTGCKEGPGADGKDPRIANPILSRLLTCHNMNMAQFADLLQNLAPGYIHAPVLDATGIDGGFDFTLSFSAAGLLQSPGGRGGDAGPPTGGAASASDPNGAVSLLDAVKQFGLKLEKQTRPIAVLVVDHVEQKPIDN
jgi:uncharacterized protein (TIGR03435 family)